MFSRIVPSNMAASYIISVMLDLSYYRLRFWISTPSIIILPSVGSSILSIVSVIVDFPAPVLPTIPILWFGLILKLKFYRTKGKDYRYLTE